MDAYDFIVVGTGSGGAVVAARLSENPNVRVLALEAGNTAPAPETTPRVSDPTVWYTLFGSDVDWGYSSIPQPALNGRQTYEPRGKMPGGSSNLCIMMHIRGHPSDYDNWAYNGCPGWRYEDCLPYFRMLEDQEDDTSPWAGKGGPIPVQNARDHDPNPTSRAFLEACAELGYPSTEDFNGPNMEAAGWHHLNIRNGKRSSTNEGYVQPALQRPNFTLSPNSHATRLLFEGGRCIGVEYARNGEVLSARANFEVIVSCGALESPKLLLLSGIGHPAQLRQFDIPMVADLPGVGENFHNHVLTGVICEASQSVPVGHQNLSEAALFCKSEPGMIGPDLQIGFVHVPFNILVGRGHPNSISILPGVVRPLSRGDVRLLSADPLAKPRVNPNYLGAQADLDRLLQAVRIARDIFGAKAFAPWLKQELMPGPQVRSDLQLHEFARSSADSYHHHAGSCKMGSDAMAVVDPRLRVYGIEGLRVADASVMPQVPSGNCHAGVVMIGERCAELIKVAHRLDG